jgi:hypothetical protein
LSSKYSSFDLTGKNTAGKFSDKLNLYEICAYILPTEHFIVFLNVSKANSREVN